MTKIYHTHTIDYKGDIDENGIWGIWDNGEIKGGFHIWPIKKYSLSGVIIEKEEFDQLIKEKDIDRLLEIYLQITIKEQDQLNK